MPLIRVDVRENALAQALADLVRLDGTDQAAAIEVQRAALPVADAVVVGAAGTYFVERKTVADLAASIKDGRLRDQRARLLEAAEGEPNRVVFVVEGRERIGATRTATVHGMLSDAVWGAMVNTCLRDRMVVLRSADAEETAFLLTKIARGAWVTSSSSSPGGPAGRQRTPAMLRAERPGGIAACMIEAIPGMGPRRAEAIAEHLLPAGGLLGLRGMSRADAVRTVAGIQCGGRRVGPALAAKLLSAVGSGDAPPEAEATPA